MRPYCTGCGKYPDEITEYILAAADEDMSPDAFVRHEEGTYNVANGHFLCTTCYEQAGMPSAPGGWVAP